MNPLQKLEYGKLFSGPDANKFNAQQETKIVDKFTAGEAQIRTDEKDVGRVRYIYNFVNEYFAF